MERKAFRNKGSLVWVLAACIFEVFFSGRSINKPASSLHDWIHIGGLLFCGWIAIALTIRTTCSKERFLFAAVSIVFILWTALAVMLPSLQIVHIVRLVILLMWVSATVTGIAICLGMNRPEKDPATS